MLSKRIIHHRDGAISTQPYGTTDAHHLLSIPARSCRTSCATRRFGRARVPLRARMHRRGHRAARGAGLRPRGRATWVEGRLLVGCDGLHSVVRETIATLSPDDMWTTRRHIAHGHAEITMDYDGADPTGMHLWPRGDHFLQAQPNRDGTFTTSLFKPWSPRAGHLVSPHSPRPTRSATTARLSSRMSSADEQVEKDLTARPPGALRVVRCAPTTTGARCSWASGACRRPVLRAGDQLQLRGRRHAGAPPRDLKFAALSEATRRSRTSWHSDTATHGSRPGHALSELSLQNLEELSEPREQPRVPSSPSAGATTARAAPGVVCHRCISWSRSPTCPTTRLSACTGS